MASFAAGLQSMRTVGSNVGNAFQPASVLSIADDAGLFARLGDHEWQECRLQSWDIDVINADTNGCLAATQITSRVLVQVARVDTGINQIMSCQ
jgi:hypothetical protein